MRFEAPRRKKFPAKGPNFCRLSPAESAPPGRAGARNAHMVKPLRRLPGESAPAHEAFVTYAEMGARRSLAAVGRKLGKSGTLMERWSAKFGWVGRAATYDSNTTDTRARAREAAEAAEARRWARRRSEQSEEEFQLGQRLIEKAKQMLELPLVEVKARRVIERCPEGHEKIVQVNIIKPVRFRAADSARLLLAADTLIRRALGMPASGLGVARESLPAAEETVPITDEELRRVARGGAL